MPLLPSFDIAGSLLRRVAAGFVSPLPFALPLALITACGGTERAPVQTARTSTAVPAVEPAGEPLSANEIRETVEGNSDAFQQCYIAGLMRSSQLTGTVRTSLEIGADGSVAVAEVIGNDTGDDEFGECVAGQFRELRFRQSGSPFDVEYPLTFRQ